MLLNFLGTRRLLISIFLCLISGLSQAGNNQLYAVVQSKSGKYGYINTFGKVVIKPQFEDANEFCNGLAVVKINGKYGYINESGEFIIEPKFKSVESFCKKKLAPVELDNGEKGYINLLGELVIKLPSGYNNSRFSDNGLARIYYNKNKKPYYGYINEQGIVVIKPQHFDFANHFGNSGLAAIELGGKAGYIDESGKVFFIKDAVTTDNFSDNGLALVSMKNNKYDYNTYGYINTKGKLVIKPIFTEALRFKNGLAAVQVDEKEYGFIDKSGKFVIPPKYYSAHYFTDNGLAIACINIYKCGYIDKSGKMVIPAIYDILGIMDFHNDWSQEMAKFSDNGLAYVVLNEKEGYINEYGVWVSDYIVPDE